MNTSAKRAWKNLPHCSFCAKPIPNGQRFVSLNADRVVFNASDPHLFDVEASHSLAYYCLKCQPFKFVPDDKCQQAKVSHATKR